jgi:hypothetical protein
MLLAQVFPAHRINCVPSIRWQGRPLLDGPKGRAPPGRLCDSSVGSWSEAIDRSRDSSGDRDLRCTRRGCLLSTSVVLGLRRRDPKSTSCVIAIETASVVSTNSEGCPMPKKLQSDDDKLMEIFQRHYAELRREHSEYEDTVHKPAMRSRWLARPDRSANFGTDAKSAASSVKDLDSFKQRSATLARMIAAAATKSIASRTADSFATARSSS